MDFPAYAVNAELPVDFEWVLLTLTVVLMLQFVMHEFLEEQKLGSIVILAIERHFSVLILVDAVHETFAELTKRIALLRKLSQVQVNKVNTLIHQSFDKSLPTTLTFFLYNFLNRQTSLIKH